MDTIIKPVHFREVEIKIGDSSSERIKENRSFAKKQEVTKEKSLFLVNDEYRIELTDNVIIGSNKTVADYIISNVNVSRRHCQITKMDRGYYVEDLGSLNGTFINNYRLSPGRIQRIMPGDRIRIANVALQLIEQ